MNTISDKSCRENRNIHFTFSNFFFENRAGYEIICKNFVQRSRPQMTIWRMRNACCITKATNPHTEYMVCPNSNENDFLYSAEGPGKEGGSRGRWRGNPGIQFDLSQLSPRLCSSRYVSKVRGSFCVLSRAKMQRSLEQRYTIKFCAKLGKSGSETL